MKTITHAILGLVLASTAVHGAPLAVSGTTFQQASTASFATKATLSPTIQIQPIQTIQIQPIQSATLSTATLSTAALSTAALSTATLSKAALSPTLSTATLSVKPQVVLNATTATLTKIQPVKAVDAGKLGTLKLDPVKTVSELTLDAASLASVTLQPAKATTNALLNAANDPADAARLAVNNENIVPAAKVVTQGSMVVLMDEREERRKAMATETAAVKQVKDQPRVTATAASRRDTIAASIGRARRLATTTSATKRLTDVSLPR